LAQLSTPTGNELIPLTNDGYERENHERALLDRQSYRCGMILNLDELVTIVHPPSGLIKSRKLLRDNDGTKAAPLIAKGHRLVLGHNRHHNASSAVSLSNDQRTKHLHVIGSSGSGKSTLLLNLIKQDLEHGEGICVIDPHGDLIDSVISHVPDNRIEDVVLFDPSDSEFPVGFNILHAKSSLEKSILSSDLIATFRGMSSSWGDVMDSVLANAILAFLESPRGGTLIELKRFLVEKEFREEYLTSVTDLGVRYFWQNEFPLIAGKPQASILIRLDGFLRQPLIRNIVCQKENRLDFRGIIDNRKILLVKLSEGQLGQENSYLLGTMLVSRLHQAAMGRQDTSERPYFWLYIDEFHHFITPSLERILSGTRKYNMGLILAHQEFRQVQGRSQEVASSVVSNCYTRICFRLGDTDAERFAAGFSHFDTPALQNLGVGEAIARVERADYDFNFTIFQTTQPRPAEADRRRSAIYQWTRQNFARPRLEVEEELSAARRPAHAEVAKRTAESTGRAAPQQQREEKVPRRQRPSKNEAEHQHLQNLVKQTGESEGFIATVEREVLSGAGRIDVALEDGGFRLACEISVTNTSAYEVQNIQKCLDAGYDQVVVISPDQGHLKSIRRRAERILSPAQLDRTHFLEPENFHLFLQSLAGAHSRTGPAEKTLGYRVETVLIERPPQETAAKRSTIRDIMSRAMRRKGPQSKDN
jgi:energy-coupling factor transporter ATP-binding protein EcfA2